MLTAKPNTKAPKTHTPTKHATIVDGRYTYDVKLWQQHEQSWAALVKRNGGHVQLYKARTKALLYEQLNFQYNIDFHKRMEGGAA